MLGSRICRFSRQEKERERDALIKDQVNMHFKVKSMLLSRSIRRCKGLMRKCYTKLYINVYTLLKAAFTVHTPSNDMVRVGAVVAAAAQNHHLHERRIRQNHQQHDYGSINQPATTLTASEPSDGSELAFDDEESLLDDDDDYDAPPFPSYSAFKAAHLLVDMPMTLIILIAFGLLSAFGWPSADMIGLHWSAIGLGAVTWIASEAIRRRLFRFASSSAAWAAPNSRTTAILQSTSFLLLLHTTIQESLRLFAIYISVKGPPELVHTHGLPRPHAIPPKGFFTAFDLALGFAAAETIWRTCELLGNISLYRGEQALLSCYSPAY